MKKDFLKYPADALKVVIVREICSFMSKCAINSCVIKKVQGAEDAAVKAGNTQLCCDI